MIVPIDKKKLLKVLDERGVAAVVGVYGSGKGLIFEWLVEELKGRGDRVARVSLKDLPKPAEDDIPELFGRANWVSLHSFLRQLVEKMRKGKYLVIMIEEAQQLMQSGDKLWEILISLRYYQRERVRIVFFGQPLLLGQKSVHLRRLLKGNVVYPRRLMEGEAREYLDKNRYAKAIYRLAHGHFGTIKYIPQLISENNFTGVRLTESRVISWARERGDMDYFVHKVWEGISSAQQRQVRQYLHNHGKGIGDVQELVDTGILWRGGGRLNWCVPWTLPFVREYLSHQLVIRRELGESELEQFGEKERRFLKEICKHKDEVVKYSDLADVVWGEEGDYNLWSLSRLAGRVKSKLAEIGYEGYLQNERGVGYLWRECG